MTYKISPCRITFLNDLRILTILNVFKPKFLKIICPINFLPYSMLCVCVCVCVCMCMCKELQLLSYYGNAKNISCFPPPHLPGFLMTAEYNPKSPPWFTKNHIIKLLVSLYLLLDFLQVHSTTTTQNASASKLFPHCYQCLKCIFLR